MTQPQSASRAWWRAGLCPSSDPDDVAVDCAEFEVGPVAFAARLARLSEGIAEIERSAVLLAASRPSLS